MRAIPNRTPHFPVLQTPTASHNTAQGRELARAPWVRNPKNTPNPNGVSQEHLKQQPCYATKNTPTPRVTARTLAKIQIMFLLAVTQYGMLIGLPSAILCITLVLYLIAAPVPKADHRASITAWRIIVHVTLAFAAIWLWMYPTLYLGAWGFVLGDNGGWFYICCPFFAAAIALVTSCVALFRTLRGFASRHYLAWLAWAPPVLLLVAGVVYAEEMLDRMEGTTPAAAAQHIVSRYANFNKSMKVVEYIGPPLFPDGPNEQHTFWVLDGEKKIALIMVWRNGALGWKLLRSQGLKQPTDILMDAHVHIQMGDKQKARYCLEQVIAAMPGTDAETEARRLLSTSLEPTKR
jgi:hypothetical protein